MPCHYRVKVQRFLASGILVNKRTQTFALEMFIDKIYHYVMQQIHVIRTKNIHYQSKHNPTEMVINRILYLSLTLSILTNFYVAANDDVNVTSIKYQSGKVRKQVPAEPLNGMYLRDAVVHLSQALQSIVDEELGISSFQRIINKMEFTNVSNNMDTRLNLLVDKFNNKLKSYTDVLEQSYNAVHLILSKNQSISSSQMASLNIAQNIVSDICTQIATGISVK
jgi:hypothetical protein